MRHSAIRSTSTVCQWEEKGANKNLGWESLPIVVYQHPVYSEREEQGLLQRPLVCTEADSPPFPLGVIYLLHALHHKIYLLMHCITESISYIHCMTGSISYTHCIKESISYMHCITESISYLHCITESISYMHCIIKQENLNSQGLSEDGTFFRFVPEEMCGSSIFCIIVYLDASASLEPTLVSWSIKSHIGVCLVRGVQTLNLFVLKFVPRDLKLWTMPLRGAMWSVKLFKYVSYKTTSQKCD